MTEMPTINPEAAKERNLLLLPQNLAVMSKLTADYIGKFAITGVRLISTETGYRVEATDAEFGGVVSGIMEDTADYPELPAIQAATNDATDAIVPASTWTEAFKLPPKKGWSKPITRNLAAVLGRNETTFGATDSERTRTITTCNVEGLFPDMLPIIDDPKRQVVKSVRVNAKRLRELLAVAEAFCADGDEHTSVTIELSETGPVFVRSQNTNQKFTGLLMPLV